MNFAGSAAAETSFPLCRQPWPNRDAIKVRFNIDAFVLADPRLSLYANAFVAAPIGCKIEIVKGQQRFRDQDVCAAKIEIGDRRHLQSAARCEVLKIRTVGPDEQLRSEEAWSLATKPPGDVGLFRFNFLQINSVRQKKCKPGFWGHCFWMSLVNLDLHFACTHLHTINSPLPQQYAPGIELGCDAASVE